MKVVITGGSSGIGYAIVRKFLDNGHVVYNLDIKNDLSHKNYHYICTDVSQEAEIIKACAKIKDECLHINSLILSAGKHLSANIENTSTQELHEVLNLNLLGAYWMIQNIIPLMKQNGGSIITIGSDQSSVGKKNSAVYGMTKGALLQLTKSIALDYAEFNIRANCLGVGTVDTPLYQAAIQKYATKSGIDLDIIKKDEAKEQPLGRVGLPDEIAALAYFLTQPNATFITGALVPIDGGYIAR